MDHDSAASPPPAASRIRVWPAAAVVVLYWTFQIIVAQTDMAMFPRFLSNSLGALAFLLLSIVLWLTNGRLTGRMRLLGLAVLLGGLFVGVLLADRSFNPVSFLLTAVPYVLTTWAGWLMYVRRSGAPSGAGLAAVLLGTIGVVDLIRWNGLDGRLRSSVSWRWSATPEQIFLASKPATVTGEISTRPWTLRAGDSPEFRGLLRDGVVRGVRIATNWMESPPEKIWRQGVGPGWSSVTVVDGYLVTQEQRGDCEAVVCYDAETGKEVWIHQDPARFTEGISGAGPRATPTYRDGRIYAFGAGGLLLCLDSRSGKAIWSRDVAREAAAPPPQWGYSASPLVAGERVVVFAGGSKGTAAFDASTGAPAWAREGGKDSYSSAQLVSIRGQAQILMQDSQRMTGLSLADGALLWERANPTPPAAPMLQPHPLEGGMLLASTGQDLALLELREEGAKWTVVEKWASSRFRPSFGDFVVHHGCVFGLDDGVLSCVDIKTGERVWKKGRYGSGQLLLLEDQGVLVILSEKGELALVEARPEAPGEVFRFPAIDGKTWNHPVLVQDRIFVRNATEMACYRLRSPKTP